MIDLDHPHLMTPEEKKIFLKMYEQTRPKFNATPKLGIVFITGTGGNFKQ